MSSQPPELTSAKLSGATSITDLFRPAVALAAATSSIAAGPFLGLHLFAAGLAEASLAARAQPTTSPEARRTLLTSPKWLDPAGHRAAGPPRQPGLIAHRRPGTAGHLYATAGALIDVLGQI